MNDGVIEIADKLWRGELSVTSLHPVGYQGPLAEVRDGVAFIPSFANVSAFSTSDGLVFVDTGSSFVAASIHEEIRKWTDDRLDTAIYSHGHIDHVFGVPVFEREAEERGWRPPVVVAHEALPLRFDRYILTAGYNAVINRRQFQAPGLHWPTEYRYPDRTYSDRLDLQVGGVAFELHHAKGETDDHTWTWVGERKTLCCGDLFIWASPNAGNPQKVQRFPGEWAAALREMVELGPEILLPGHGFPVIGADRVRQALTETAELLESLLEQTLALMNEGARLDEILHTVEAPRHLLERPYLRPVYDEPEFVVRNIWRLYGGWYDGDPSTLKPARSRALAAELASLAGGASVLADRAQALADEAGRAAGAGTVGASAAGASGGSASGASGAGASGTSAGGSGTGRPGTRPFSPELRLAGHLAEMAILADPSDPGARRVHSEVFAKMAAAASSTMAKGIYSWAATGSDHPEDPEAGPG
jgi:glyoxylase-like metal-dependent hydrolase (beta-lactamase superfamily II)